MNKAKIKVCLAAIKKIAQILESELENSNELEVLEELDSIENTRSEQIKSFLNDPNWPTAVPAFHCQEPSDEDQRKRAKAAMDMILTRTLTNADFLDFGCGDGWMAKEAIKRGARISDGYDIKKSNKWNLLQEPNLSFTTAFHDLHDLYDVIVLYDVLDHVHDPLDVMYKIKSLLKPNGIVYIRCHPWTAKHATHLYKQGINKAYFHLFLTWDELTEQLGHSPIFTRPEIDPISAYHYWFQNFKISKEHNITEPLHDFFETPVIKKLIKESQKISSKEIDTFMKRLEIQFVDFCLEHHD